MQKAKEPTAETITQCGVGLPNESYCWVCQNELLETELSNEILFLKDAELGGIDWIDTCVHHRLRGLKAWLWIHFLFNSVERIADPGLLH